MIRNRLSLCRRLVGAALLVCVGLSSAEVVWAGEPGELPTPTLTLGSELAVADTAESPTEPATDDCACLCTCGCATAQQVTPAVLPFSLGPDPLPAAPPAAFPERTPPASSPQPHLRPPIA